LSNDRLPKKPLAQQCWQPIVTAQTEKKSAHTKNKQEAQLVLGIANLLKMVKASKFI